MLGTEPDQDDRALAMPHRDGRRFLGNHLFAEQPTTLQDVALDIRRQDVHILAAIG